MSSLVGKTRTLVFSLASFDGFVDQSQWTLTQKIENLFFFFFYPYLIYLLHYSLWYSTENSLAEDEFMLSITYSDALDYGGAR